MVCVGQRSAACSPLFFLPPPPLFFFLRASPFFSFYPSLDANLSGGWLHRRYRGFPLLPPPLPFSFVSFFFPSITSGRSRSRPFSPSSFPVFGKLDANIARRRRRSAGSTFFSPLFSSYFLWHPLPLRYFTDAEEERKLELE